jgi:excinuclease ABC subunit B
MAARSSTPTTSLGRCNARSTRPIGAGPGSSSTTQHGITPQTIVKAVQDIMEGARASMASRRGAALDDATPLLGPEQAMKRIKKLEAEMYKHARNLEFEEAARIRDEIEKMRNQAFGVPGTLAG